MRYQDGHGLAALTLALVVVAATFGVGTLYANWLADALKSINRGPAVTELLPESTATDVPDTTVVLIVQYPDNESGVLMVRVAEDGDGMRVAGLPRTTRLPGDDKTLGARLAETGQVSAISFVENLTGERVDHLVTLDMVCLVQVADQLGGIPIPTQSQAGSGELVAYLGGPQGRHEREVTVLDALAGQGLSFKNMTSPRTIRKVLNTVEKCLTVDEGLTPTRLNAAAWDIQMILVARESVAVPQDYLTPEAVVEFQRSWSR